MSSSTLKLQTPRAFLPLLQQARYKGAHGGRGSGKSHFFAELMVEECVADSSTRAVCVREVQKSLDQSVKQLIEDKIRELDVGDCFEILDTEIHVLNEDGERDGIIIFQGMQNHTADSIKSLEGYRIAWVEEAQSVSQRSIDLLTPTLRVAGAQIWFSWNPRKETDPVDRFMRSEDAAGDPDIICIEVNYHDNPWFHQTALAADMERDRRRDPDKYAHVWLGGYDTKSEARVFKNWKVEEFTTPRGVTFKFGADWGFAQDPTVLVRCYLDGRKLYVDREAYKVGCEIDETPALFAGDCPEDRKDERGQPMWSNPAKRPDGSPAWEPHAGVPGALTNVITADSARPETISYMRRRGFQVKGAIKGPGSLEDGIEFLKSYDIIVHPDCSHVADELALYSFKTDPLTNEILSVLEDKNNHTIDALRYALEALRRSAKAAKPEAPAPKRDGYWPKDDIDADNWKVV